MEDKNIDSKVYEVGFLLIPSLTEEEVPTVYGDMKSLILSLGGEMISDEMPKMIDLAYTMKKTIQNLKNKFDSAYFSWVKFFMDADKVSELKKKLDLDPKIIRFLIVKTVKENTIATKKFNYRDSSRGRRPSFRKDEVKEETSLPINKEEVDKEIEAMIAE
ncbi:MAG: 30S ribosomal protein S6 [Patescibacteria group bacterium]